MCHAACDVLYMTHARLSLLCISACSRLPGCFFGIALRRFTMGRGKKRKRDLPMPPPAAPWVAESEDQWWSLVEGYEDKWLSYDSHELDQKRIQELEDLLHAEKSQRKKAQDLLAKHEKMHHRLLNIVVKEFTLPRPPEPMPQLTRVERKREMEKYEWVVVVDDAGPAPADAASRTRAVVQSR